MDLNIQVQIEKLQELFAHPTDDTYAQMRDDALLLADYLEQAIYQRDAEKIVAELIAETGARPTD